MAERDDQDGETPKTTEELMKSAPPPSVLGDVEDAVAPEVEGEETTWAPRAQNEGEGET